jgi:signal transduction histidine kinase
MREKLADTEGYVPKLVAATRQADNNIIIKIADNGPGIPEEIVDKIMQPFFTTKKGTEGTGLGLSITHDIIESHGGELKVESRMGEGAAFTIILPV